MLSALAIGSAVYQSHPPAFPHSEYLRIIFRYLVGEYKEYHLVLSQHPMLNEKRCCMVCGEVLPKHSRQIEALYKTLTNLFMVRGLELNQPI